VLNAVTLFNTRYMNAALDQLRAQGHPVLDADVARLSPLIRKHLNVHGRYSFLLPELPGDLRSLRDPTPSTTMPDRPSPPMPGRLNATFEVIDLPADYGPPAGRARRSRPQRTGEERDGAPE